MILISKCNHFYGGYTQLFCGYSTGFFVRVMFRMLKLRPILCLVTLFQRALCQEGDVVNASQSVPETMEMNEMIAKLITFLMITLLVGCGGGSDVFRAPDPAAPGASSSVASLQLSISPTTVKSDNSTTTTITVVALNSVNAAVPNVVVNMGTNTGVLGAATVTTDATGKATLDFSSGASSKSNRTATIAAVAGSVSAQIPVQIVGSTVTVSSSSNSLPDDGASPATLTVTAKDAGGSPVSGVIATLTNSGSGNVTFTPSSGTTNGNGIFTATVAGAGAGTATVTAAAVGATATTALTISPSGATFAIDQQTLNSVLIANSDITAMKIGDSLVIRVNAPTPATSVMFATTTGIWNGVASVVPVSVVGGKATATLTTSQAGIANIQVYDQSNPSISDTLTVTMTSATATKISLQASPGVVQKSVGNTTGSSILIATVRDANNFPVGDAPVAFEIINPTGGGETVSPVVVLSASTTSGGLNLGEARTTFVSGSLASDANGIKIRARVVGTTVVTEATGVDVTPSGNDAAIIIGGTAGSIAFGQATVLQVGGGGTTYILPMSVLVADANGNPAPQGTVVNLSVWPIAWSTGGGCAYNADTATTGTFFNEDSDENVTLNGSEDGTRRYFATGGTVTGGRQDGLITPTNSASGTLPSVVTTDASGVATFNLTYGKSSAIWIIDRVRARTVVQGSETVGETIFRLAALEEDITPVCRLPSSPYLF